MSPLVEDLRHALRSLRRSPGFVAAAAAIFTLGIGANTADEMAVTSYWTPTLGADGGGEALRSE